MKITKIKKSYVAIGVVVLIVGGYYLFNKSKSTATGVSYKTAQVEKGTITSAISASGNVVVDDSATVDPTITGTVYGLAVSVGDEVEKGQLLFMIENNELGIDVNKAYSSYLQSQASLENAKASKKEAKNNYEDANSENKNVMKKKLNAAEISLEAAEKNVETSKASYQNSLSDASKRKVTAPISGTVNVINIKNGDDLGRLSSNSNSSAPIIIGDMSTLKAQVEVNEVDISNVTLGQEAKLTFSAIDGLEVRGKVEKIDSLGTLSSGVVSYNVTIVFDSLDPKIKPEMSVSASIITGIKQDVLLVPSSAVKSQNGKSYVQIMKEGEPEKKNVEVGLSDNTKTEIISGINAGDKVVTQTINSSTPKTTTSTSRNNVRIPGMGG